MTKFQTILFLFLIELFLALVEEKEEVKRGLKNDPISIFLQRNYNLTDSQKRLSAFIGIGYDTITGNPIQDQIDSGFKQPIFNLTYEQQHTTDDKLYSIPDGCSSLIKTSCSRFQNAQNYANSKSYQKYLKTLANVNGAFSDLTFLASFSANAQFEQLKQMTDKEEKTIVESGARCELYGLSMPLLGSIKLTDNFMNLVRAASNQTHGITWQSLIQKFGTHYVEQVTFGGRCLYQYAFTSRSIEELRLMSIDVSLTAKMFSNGIQSGIKASDNKTQAFMKRIEDTKEIYIGSEPNKDWAKWHDSLKTNPAPIQYTLFPLADLLMPYYFSEYTQEQLNKMKVDLNKEVNSYCKENGCRIPSNGQAKKKLTARYMFSPIEGLDQKGIPFNDSFKGVNPVMSVRKVTVRSNSHINSLQLTLSDDINTRTLSQHGGDDGTQNEFLVPHNEVITQVEVRYGKSIVNKYLNSITFITNKGTKSMTFGTNEDEYYMFRAPENGHLIGIQGKVKADCKSKCLTAIGFIWMIPEYF
jgi:hypothetical protein